MVGLSLGNVGSHIRLQKHRGDEMLKLTVPAHKPIKRSTLLHIIKQAHMQLDQFFSYYNQAFMATLVPMFAIKKCLKGEYIFPRERLGTRLLQRRRFNPVARYLMYYAG